jgi:hypothetical protein
MLDKSERNELRETALMRETGDPVRHEIKGAGDDGAPPVQDSAPTETRQPKVRPVQCEFRRANGGGKWDRELFQATSEKYVIIVGLSAANVATQSGRPLRDLVHALKDPKFRSRITRVIFLEASAGYPELRDALADGRESEFLKMIRPDIDVLRTGGHSVPFGIMNWVEARAKSSGILAELEEFF